MFDRLCIIGPGLIGGSIAKAARERDLCRRISAYGREEDAVNLEKGKALRVIDDYHHDIKNAVDGADCVMIAAPVGATGAILTLLKPLWQRGVIYTDVGSTKNSVIQAARHIFGKVPENFIPAHPIAGAEKSGVEAALADLFLNKRLIITPEPSADLAIVEQITRFWQALGAKVESMSAEHHDAVFAATSHLPHLVAFALVDMLGHKDEQSEIFKYAAGGFKDFTRIASSDPNMWLDICLANKQEIVPLIAQLKQELDKLQQFLETDDKNRLLATFSYARQARQRFLSLYDN
jgi:prephenate dehydrogenase